MDQGLTQEQAAQRLKETGGNKLTATESFSGVKLFFSQFPSFVNGILFLAAFLSFFLRNFVDGFFIIGVLLVNGIFSFAQEFKAEQALKKLQELTQPTCRVMRDDKMQEIPVGSVVVDDIVVLTEGDKVPADGKIISNNAVEVDESLITGESLPVVRQHGEKLLRGTFLSRGKTHMRVSAVGNETRFGQIAQTMANIEYESTPLQKQIAVTTKVLSLIAIVFAALLIPIGLLQHGNLFFLMLLAVSIAIAAIPESLPGIITISLAIGANRMAKKKAIIRKMAAIETLGSMQIVLLDKTGTLTQNSMRVKETWLPHDNKAFFAKACLIGNTATFSAKEEIIGDKTDGALLQFAKTLISHPLEGAIVDEYAFDPQTQTITTVWREGKKTFVFVKGAPEKIIAKSILTKAERERAEDKFRAFASLGLRVIALSYKEEPTHEKKSRKVLEDKLHLLGFAALFDPPREDARQAITEAKNAGISLLMVTGDNDLTALSIAQSIGLAGTNDTVMTGEKLQHLSDAQVEEIITTTHIFARTQPEDKLRLTRIARKAGFIVGVTGDGVNDALALKQADVGVAMGKKGTDVAKEASDMIITNDSFSSLMHAVEEGRIVYHNLKQAITYLIAGNFSELLLIGIATALGAPSPLLPTQILWMNLVTDVFPALSLAADKGHADMLHESPRGQHQPFISLNRWLSISGIGILLAILAFILFVSLLSRFSLKEARTITLTAFIFSHMALAFFVRGRHGFTINKYLLGSVVLIVISQCVIIFVPFFQTIFGLGWQ